MIFAAIDPGSVHAAIAVFHDTPRVRGRHPHRQRHARRTAFAHALQDMKVERLVVENVHAMPFRASPARSEPSVLRDQFPDLDLQRFQEQQLPLIQEKLLQ